MTWRPHNAALFGAREVEVTNACAGRARRVRAAFRRRAENSWSFTEGLWENVSNTTGGDDRLREDGVDRSAPYQLEQPLQARRLRLRTTAAFVAAQAVAVASDAGGGPTRPGAPTARHAARNNPAGGGRARP